MYVYMHACKISVAITKHDHDIYFPCCSDSDITALAKNRTYAHINLEDMTIHQVVIYLYRCIFDYIVDAIISFIFVPGTCIPWIVRLC